MTAVLVYGRLNLSKEHYSNISQSFGDVDYFVSSDNSPIEHFEDFVRLYQPVLYTNQPIVHSYQIHHYPNKPEETPLDKMIRHFINKKRVFELMKQSGKVYKTIVSVRIDVILNHTFQFHLKPRHIYIPIGKDYRDGINDQIAIGDEYVMEKYMKIVDNMEYLLESGRSIPHPETLTLANLMYNKIPIVRFCLDYRLDR